MTYSFKITWVFAFTKNIHEFLFYDKWASTICILWLRKTSLVCNINIPDVILPSDAEYLTLVGFMWKLSNILVSSAREVHVSAAYWRTEVTSALYVLIFVGSVKRRSRYILFREIIAEDARAMRLWTYYRLWELCCRVISPFTTFAVFGVLLTTCRR